MEKQVENWIKSARLHASSDDWSKASVAVYDALQANKIHVGLNSNTRDLPGVLYFDTTGRSRCDRPGRVRPACRA